MMHFNDLLNHDEKDDEPKKPEINHQRSSINILLNNDSNGDSNKDDSLPPHGIKINSLPNLPTTKESPMLSHKQSTETLKRSSIASITNDIDIDIDGNQTLNVVRRASFSSDANSPIVSKATISQKITDNELIYNSPIIDKNRSHRKPEGMDKSEKKNMEQMREDVKHELEKLDKEKQLLKDKKKKPKKYELPPIWAQEWIPPNKKRNKPSKVMLSVPSKYEDLENSITGKTPYEDLSRRVGQWIYAHFENINEADYPNIELEAKLGRIWDKATDQRIQLPISTECLVVDSVNYTFKPGVEEPMFNLLTRFLTDLETNNKNGRKFSTLNYKNEDKFYKEVIKNLPPRNIRVTKDLDSKRDIAIEKKRIADLFMHLPDSIVDIRLSLSLEIPVQVNDKYSKMRPTLTRLKTRTSYIHSKTCSRFDLTRVNTESKKGPEISHEIEVEADILQLLDSYKKVKNQTDVYRYEEIVKIFLDNVRIVSRQVSKKV